MNIRRSIILRVRVAFLIIGIFAIAALVRIFMLQTVDDRKWARLAEEIDLQFRKVPATRGNIYSDNGSLLATSLPSYRIAFDPTMASDELYKKGIDSLTYKLSWHFNDRSRAHYKRSINDARLAGKQYIILNRKLVKYQEKKEMAKWPIFREGRLKGGIIFEKLDRRSRPFSYLGYRTVGFVNDNNDGAGLEYSFNRYLSGKDGKALYQKIAGGKWRPLHDRSEVRPVEGYDIHTTINVNLQDVTESALLKALKDHEADYGCAVVMEVATGDIKAISNLTKNEKYHDYREVFNYAVQGLSEPGSTFKLASMIALLEDSNLKLTDSIETGDGAYKFYNETMRDHKPGGYGTISVRQAFEYSSNIAISKMIYSQFGSDPQLYIDYMNSFGLSQPLGFQMVGEGIPKIKNPSDKSWSGITLPWMSIGYEVEITPLQILAFYNAIANDGKMIRPIIVKSITQADNEIKYYESQVIKRKICSAKTLKEVRSLLEGVVENGTARNIKNSYYKIAGKTGTAQKIVNGRHIKKYNTSFVGYFPANDPQYSCIIIIDKPKGFRQYGSNVAAPVFKEIADKIYARDLKMHAPYIARQNVKEGIFPVIKAGNREDLQKICDEFLIPNQALTDEEWVKAQRKDNAVLWTTDEIAPEVIPDVLGMTLRDAIFL
ncbi:MAG: penicillin-binding protein 2, partial [Cyclobacteriaceae bacterium]|nr:penicillin-binding protein 2 [Cyclobacteriaceae bacterium]